MVLETLDSRPSNDGVVTEIAATKPRYEPYVRQALSNLQFGDAAVQGTAAVASMLFQAQPGSAHRRRPRRRSAHRASAPVKARPCKAARLAV